MSDIKTPIPENVEFLRDFKIFVELEIESGRNTPWSERDEHWFRQDARKNGMLHILKLLFQEEKI